MDEENAICGGQEVVKPGQVLFEVWGEGAIGYPGGWAWLGAHV